MAVSHTHLSCVWKQVKLSGSFLSLDHLQIRINTAFRYSYVILVFGHFLDKIISNESVSEIAIDLLSELIVKNVTQTKSNDVHNRPGYKYESGRVSSICTIF